MNERRAPEYTWLEKSHPNIKWRLIGPNIRNPFDSLTTDLKLESYTSDRYALMEVCQVMAIMDESTILKITDLDSLQFLTEHPNLVSLQREDLDAYLKTSGVWDKISADFNELQKECRRELDARKNS